jgi:NTE family protein
MSRPRVALVIGSGGLKCAAALGVWRRLAEAGVAIDLVVGSSGGAIFGALAALGFDPEQAPKTAMKLWRSDVTKRVNYPALGRAMLPGLLKFNERFGIFRDTRLRLGFEAAYGKFTMFHQTRIPLFVVATDLRSGEPVVLSEGRVAQAVRASASIPVVFEPVEIDGRMLLDGGVSNPLPVDVAVREGADLIIAVAFEAPPQKDVRTAGAYAQQMFANISNRLLAYQFAAAGLLHHAEIISIVPQFEQNIGLNDSHRIPEIMEQGARATEPHLEYIRRLMG